MNRTTTIIFAFLIALPLFWLSALGVRVARQGDEDRRRLYEGIMRREAESAERLLQAEVAGVERRVRETLARMIAEPDAADEILRRSPELTGYLVLDNDGSVIIPDPASAFAPEVALRTRTAHITDGGDLVERVSGTDRAGDRGSANRKGREAERFGWHTWFWERGLNLLVWERAADGKIHAGEINPARFKAAMLSALPASADGDAGPVAFVLRDTRGNRLYQWGGFDPSADSRPDYVSPLTGVLSSWTLEARLDPSLSGAAAFWRATGASVIGMISAALLFVAMAWYFWREYRRDLREAADRVSFVNQVSHELKTPLTNIRLYAEMLADELEDDSPEHARQVAVIVNESHRLSRLIGNILSFGRQRRGQLTLRPAPADAAEIVRASVERFAPSFEERGMKAEITGNASGERMIDRDALEQILGNLLANAEKYASKGGLVGIRIEADEDVLVIDVRDRGPGVPTGLRERIFESFYRIHDELTEGVSGAGIGLTLSRDLARLHGGDLVCLACGEGAHFRVTLRAPKADGDKA